MIKKGWLIILLFFILGSSFLIAEELPIPLACYKKYTQARDIDGYISCFDKEAVMIDVSKTFTGKEEVRRWASREVIPNSNTFDFIEILDEVPGYFKTYVNWMSWKVHYHYWYNENGKITKMSLQYSNTGTTDRKEVYDQLPAAVKLYFDAVKAESIGMIEESFLPDSYIIVVSRHFNGINQIKRFVETEVYGGEYYLSKLHTKKKDNIKLLLRFTPKGWSNPEPDAVYDIFLKDGRIEYMNLQYAN
jgi:hypothetical protein